MKYNGYRVKFKMDRYVNGDRLYVGMDCWDEDCKGWFPYGNVTVNLDDHYYEGCRDNDAYVDANNNPNIVKFLMKHGFAEYAENEEGHVRFGYSGHCMYPLMRFDMGEINRSIADEDKV